LFRPKLFTMLRRYDRAWLVPDLTAGITVGILALPLAMAFAIASGLPPERGLFTAIVAGLLISVLGGSRVQIGGPTGAFVVIVSGIVLEHGYEGLAVCTFMAGVILVVFGLCRMGAIIRFIPFPVTTGFTTGIAVVIFTTQIKDLLGLTYDETPHSFLDTWAVTFRYLQTANVESTALGLGSIAAILLVGRYSRKIPGMLVAMAAATAVSATLGLDVDTIGSRFGDLPRTLPLPSLPDFASADFRALFPAAFTVAMLAAIESLLSATVADGMTGGRHRPDTELMGQGIANMASVLFGGIPATGAIARTATNVKSGAKTPVAGVVHAVTLALMMVLFSPWAKLVPLAALAGILVVVSYNMSEAERFVRLLRAPRSDVMVLLTTFILTVLVDLTVAVEVGVVLAALLFIRRMAEVANVEVITNELRGDQDEAADPLSMATRQLPPGVVVYEVQGPFFFGAADRFKQAMHEIQERPKVVILRLRKVPAIDATGLHVLDELHRRYRKDGTALILSGIHRQPATALKRSGLWDAFGEENIHTNIDAALERARQLTTSTP
jgi:SulP family sulfate permease